ncbi:MAG TPA: c-type cytochrome [Usitatibacter sp.]|nr:c-type cytochrome [Usitatibacter sp.]
MKFSRWLIVSLLLGLAFAPAASRAVDLANGANKFNTWCVPCHGNPPQGGAQFGANDPGRISAAIGGVVPAMVFMRTILSSADIADIAAYIGTLTSTAGPPPPVDNIPAFDFSDLWYNPDQSGWGLNLVQHASNKIFGVMYTYEAPGGRPLWLVIPDGTWTSPLRYTGAIYRVTGPVAVPFDPNAVLVRQVGVATLTFIDRNNGTIDFTIDGDSVVKSITRQPY